MSMIAPWWQVCVELPDPPFALSLRAKRHLRDATEGETFSMVQCSKF
jgi:hypothetical protein